MLLKFFANHSIITISILAIGVISFIIGRFFLYRQKPYRLSRKDERIGFRVVRVLDWKTFVGIWEDESDYDNTLIFSVKKIANLDVLSLKEGQVYFLFFGYNGTFFISADKRIEIVEKERTIGLLSRNFSFTLIDKQQMFYRVWKSPSKDTLYFVPK